MSETVSKTDNFLNAIEKYAEEQRTKLQTEARSYRKQELSKAEDEGLREAYVMIQKKMADVKTEISSELSRAENASRKKIFMRRNEIEKSVFDDVEKKVAEFTKSSDYRKMLEDFAKSISSALCADDVTLFVRAEDLKYKAEIEKAFGRNCEIRQSDDIVLGGMFGQSRSLGLLCDETLDSRLQQQHEWFCEHSGLKVSK